MNSDFVLGYFLGTALIFTCAAYDYRHRVKPLYKRIYAQRKRIAELEADLKKCLEILREQA